MRIEEVTAGVLVFIGSELESVATAFMDRGDVLLVDALASRADSVRMRNHLASIGACVRRIVLTHAMSDHMAGIKEFGNASVAAHRYYQHTFLSQRPRARNDYDVYVDPDVQIGDEMRLRWGEHQLRFFHNPGKTMDMLNVDVPTADLVIAGDAIVGNTAYLSGASPDMVDAAITRLASLGRSTVVPGHIGPMGAQALDNARHYLMRLRNIVASLPRDASFSRAVTGIPIEWCLSLDIEATWFERHWHERNLDVIVNQQVLELDAL